MPGSEFIKQLIQLLSASGGIVSLPLAELEQLGVELTLQSLGTSASTLTIRLGAKIYYVPAQPQERTWPSIPTTSPVNPTDEIEAVNELNNRPKKQRPQLPQLPEASTIEPSHTPVKKGEIDLWLAEQRQRDRQDRRADRLAKEARNASRQYPWENRK